MFEKRLVAELTALEARISAVKSALKAVMLDHWHLTSTMRASAKLCNESALFRLLD